MKVLVKITKDILERSMHCPILSDANEDEIDYLKVNCAVSLAWRDLFPKALVFQGNTILCNGVSIPHEKPMIDYIKIFDYIERKEDRLKMPEASFEVDLPEEAINEIGIGEVYKVLSESRTLELVSF